MEGEIWKFVFKSKQIDKNTLKYRNLNKLNLLFLIECKLKAIPSFIILIRFNLIRINTLSLVKLFQKGNNRNSSISNKINRGALSNSYALNT